MGHATRRRSYAIAPPRAIPAYSLKFSLIPSSACTEESYPFYVRGRNHLADKLIRGVVGRGDEPDGQVRGGPDDALESEAGICVGAAYLSGGWLGEFVSW